MRIYDTYLTGVLAGCGLRTPWGFSSVAAHAAHGLHMTTDVTSSTITANTPNSNKQRSPGTQGVPL